MSAAALGKAFSFPNEGSMQRENFCPMLLLASCLQMQLHEDVMLGVAMAGASLSSVKEGQGNQKY